MQPRRNIGLRVKRKSIGVTFSVVLTRLEMFHKRGKDVKIYFADGLAKTEILTLA